MLLHLHILLWLGVICKPQLRFVAIKALWALVQCLWGLDGAIVSWSKTEFQVYFGVRQVRSLSVKGFAFLGRNYHLNSPFSLFSSPSSSLLGILVQSNWLGIHAGPGLEIAGLQSQVTWIFQILIVDCQNLLETAWEINCFKGCLRITSNFPEVVIGLQKFNCLTLIGYTAPEKCVYYYVSCIFLKKHSTISPYRYDYIFKN